MIKDMEYKNFTKEPHECFWCKESTYSQFWSCRECHPKKEAAYKKNAEEGNKRGYVELMEFVNEEIKNEKPKK